MIGVVIGYEDGLAKDRLPLTVRNRCKQVHARIHHQSLHLFDVVLKLGNARSPGRIVGRGFVSRPVADRELRGDVVWIPAEFENVPLADAYMLEQLPGSVWASCRLDSSNLGRPLGENVPVVQVRVLPVQKASQEFPQSPFVLHARSS